MSVKNLKRKRSFIEIEENETKNNKLNSIEEPRLIFRFEKKLNLTKIKEIVN